MANGSSKTYMLNAHKQVKDAITSLEAFTENNQKLELTPTFNSKDTGIYGVAWTNPIKKYRMQNFVPNKDYVGAIKLKIKTNNPNATVKATLYDGWTKSDYSEAVVTSIDGENGEYTINIRFDGNTSIDYATPFYEYDEIKAGDITPARDVAVRIDVGNTNYSLMIERSIYSNLNPKLY